jgi:heme exporter protein A
MSGRLETTDWQKSEQTVQVPAVEVVGLKKSYGLKPTLRGIDLVLHDGERLALLGANGAGKTTLLRILAGLSRPGAGIVLIKGLSIAHEIQEIRRSVGFVAHQSYLYEELTAVENLLFFAHMYGVDHARERAVTLLQRVGLAKHKGERVATFSRGMIQRLAWARALLHEPHVLLLDEPDTGLDQEGQEVVDNLLMEHSERGGSTIFTTHQLERALALSDSIVVLRGGHITYRQKTQHAVLEEIQQAYGKSMR